MIIKFLTAILKQLLLIPGLTIKIGLAKIQDLTVPIWILGSEVNLVIS